ncbi:MAG TPA: Gfo/Idh/MocA family oxidoreductase [Candidatus Nanoarchaeia archaeon]|nr:Gfo/Idh/MocA family oxidoreductase [Candidatus Nanoarchaeia archaeon]
MNIAVIGVGSMGQNHARVLFNIDSVHLAAVVDADKNQAERIAKKYNARWYTTYQELFEKEQLDAVTIAVPTKYHKTCTIAALERKIPVLLEKPIAATIEEAQEIIALARANNVPLMIGHIERFNPAVIELKKRLDSGELGEIYKIEVQRIGPFPERIADVGVTIDLSVHDIDIIHYVMNAPIERIYAETQQRLHISHEDSLIALITYQNGVLGVINVNYLSPTKTRQLSIFGKKGMFRVNYLTQELSFYENKSFALNDWSSVSEGDVRMINIQKKEPLQLEIEHFVRHFNDPSMLVSGEDGLHALQIAHSILQSARMKQVIHHG